MPWTNYTENKWQDHMWRTTAYAQITTIYFALVAPTRGRWAASTAYSVGDKVISLASFNGRMYRCTTSGTSGGSEPTWPTTAGGTVADGSVVWTEMTPDFQAGTNIPEVSGGSYARVGVTRADANFKGTHGSTSGASSGTGGNIKNAGAITFAAPTANWGVISHVIRYDASTSGNHEWYEPLTTPKTVNSGDSAPSFPIDALSWTVNVASAPLAG